METVHVALEKVKLVGFKTHGFLKVKLVEKKSWKKLLGKKS